MLPRAAHAHAHGRRARETAEEARRRGAPPSRATVSGFVVEGGGIVVEGGGIVVEGGGIVVEGGGIVVEGGEIAAEGGGIAAEGGGIAAEGGGIVAEGGGTTPEKVALLRPSRRYHGESAMKLILALTGTLALAAPPSPFPAPKLTGVTPETKCDWGPITEVKPDRKMVVLKTDAGPLEVRIDPALKVAGADGKPMPSAELRSGQSARVYYRVDDKPGRGAMAQEIDLIPPAAAAGTAP